MERNIYHIKCVFLTIAFLIFSACSVEDEIQVEKQQINEISQTYSQEITIDEAKNAFSLQHDKTSKSKKRGYFESTPIWDINHLIDFDENDKNALTIPNFINIDNLEGVYSQVIMLRLEGEVVGVIETKVFDSNSNDQFFNGKIFYHNFDGKYVKGFRIKENLVVSEFLEKETNSSKGSGDCTSPGCQLGAGEEVIVYGRRKSGSASFASVYGGNGQDGANLADMLANRIEASASGGGASSYPCQGNFKFSSVTNNNLWQESVLLDTYQKLRFIDLSTFESHSAEPRISSLTFGMPYKNVEGGLVTMSRDANIYAGYALSTGLQSLRSYFKRNPSYNSDHYERKLISYINTAFSAMTKGKGRVNVGGSNNPLSNSRTTKYKPCV